MFLLDNKPLLLDEPFTHNGTSYPANWLRLNSLEEKQAIGIVEVQDIIIEKYDDRFYLSINNPKELEDTTITPEQGLPYIKKGLKSEWIIEIKKTANKLLTETDWMVIRKVERDVAIPTATATYRAAVITECSRLVTAIAGASDITSFIAVVTTQNWPDSE